MERSYSASTPLSAEVESPPVAVFSESEPLGSYSDEASSFIIGLRFSVRFDVSPMRYLTVSPVDRVASTTSPSG